MSDLYENVERAKKSLLFSGAHIGDHLSSFLQAQGPACEELGKSFRKKIKRIFLVGSGGTYASLLTAKYIIDRFIDIPTEVMISYEVIWRKPLLLNKDALVIFSSYSGETEDTVAAFRTTSSCGATTVVIVGKKDSTLAREANFVLPYENGAIYEIPIMAVLLFVFGLVGLDNQAPEIQTLYQSIIQLPERAQQASHHEETIAEEKARKLLSVDHLYVLGSGPLSPLAYKLAMSVIMENMRIGGSYSDASEWRHGPVEALGNIKPNIITLLGTDESRELTLRTIDFCRKCGSNVLVYDAAEFKNVHPLLTPVVMNSVTQWLVVYSAILRGITDLDERVFMGHNVLTSTGASWP